METVRYLYHGSATPNIAHFAPRLARGVGPKKDKLVAVYATHRKELAIAFALPLRPNAEGHLAWRLALPEDFAQHHPLVILEAGALDLECHGYLYRFSAESFEPIDEWQWVATQPVTPLAVELVNPTRYRDWVKCSVK
ncbi:MAG: hypothetical protein R3E79_04370 [Caldilineaceae bacterium]